MLEPACVHSSEDEAQADRDADEAHSAVKAVAADSPFPTDNRAFSAQECILLLSQQSLYPRKLNTFLPANS